MPRRKIREGTGDNARSRRLNGVSEKETKPERSRYRRSGGGGSEEREDNAMRLLSGGDDGTNGVVLM